MEVQERPLRLAKTLWARALAHAELTRQPVEAVVAAALEAHLPPESEPPPRPSAALVELDERLRTRLHLLRNQGAADPAALQRAAPARWSEVVIEAREACTEMQAVVLPLADDGEMADAARRLSALISAFSQRLDASGREIDGAVHRRRGALARSWHAAATNLLTEWDGLMTVARQIVHAAEAPNR